MKSFHKFLVTYCAGTGVARKPREVLLNLWQNRIETQLSKCTDRSYNTLSSNEIPIN